MKFLGQEHQRRKRIIENLGVKMLRTLQPLSQAHIERSLEANDETLSWFSRKLYSKSHKILRTKLIANGPTKDIAIPSQWSIQDTEDLLKTVAVFYSFDYAAKTRNYYDPI